MIESNLLSFLEIFKNLAPKRFESIMSSVQNGFGMNQLETFAIARLLKAFRYRRGPGH